MRKKILIGSIIAVVLLLLMPSIPAIQQKTIEDKTYSDLVEELKDVDLEDIEILDEIMYPILRVFVLSFIHLMNFRIGFLLIIGRSIPPSWLGIFLRVRIQNLVLSGTNWAEFWNLKSDELGWGWDDIPPPEDPF